MIQVAGGQLQGAPPAGFSASDRLAVAGDGDNNHLPGRGAAERMISHLPPQVPAGGTGANPPPAGGAPRGTESASPMIGYAMPRTARTSAAARLAMLLPAALARRISSSSRRSVASNLASRSICRWCRSASVMPASPKVVSISVQGAV